MIPSLFPLPRLQPKLEGIGGYPNYYGFVAYQVDPWLNFLSPQVLSCRFEVVPQPADTAVLPRG